MSLSVVAAPSLTDLVGQVADRLGGPRPDPFAPDYVVVPSAGVREYLVEHVPRSGSACPVLANVEFIYPGRFNALALGVERPEDDAWSVERLRWTILRVLEDDVADGSRIGAPRFADSNRRFAYANKVAGLFERYGVQRPEMLDEWSRLGPAPAGVTPNWQRVLWCRVRERIGTESPAERIVARSGLGSAVGSGRRFTLVGLDIFSPGKVRILEQLANTDDITVFTIQPSTATADPEHPLLRSWGRLAQDAAQLLRGKSGREIVRVHAMFPDTLLGRIQRDIATDRAPGSDGAQPADPTVQIHLCHGPTRQVEVLRDAILHAMADDPTLTARDVLVVCTDIEAFAPLIGPVFASLGLRAVVIDRSTATRTPVDRALELILDCVGGRCGVEPLLDLVASDLVAEAFAVTPDDVAMIGRLVRSLDVRWGLGATDRERVGIPGPHVGTWRHAVDRMLAGTLVHAVGDGPLVADVVPYDDLDGQTSLAATKLAVVLDHLETIGRLVDDAEEQAAPVAWAAVIDEIFASFLSRLPGDPRGVAEVRALRAELLAAADHAPATRLDRTEFRELLLGSQESENARSATWGDVVRVGSVNRLRGVPARVVAVLGLDDGRLRTGGGDGDDLLQDDPQAGDRDPRAEERLALLNFVMAAGERFIVLADGHSVTTNEPLAPSVVLQEWVECIAATIGTLAADDSGARDPFSDNPCVVFHSRQPFDPVNFGLGGTPRKNVGAAAAVTGPWSFDTRAQRILMTDLGAERADDRFADVPVPANDIEGEIDLDDLVRSVRYPVAHFVRHTLLAALVDDDEKPDNEIELWPGGLTQAQIGREFLAALIDGRDADIWMQGRALRGKVPPGRLAEPFWTELAPVVAEIARRSGAVGEEPTAIPLHLPERGISGSATVFGTTVVDAEYVRRHDRARMKPWLTLAALTITDPHTRWTARVVRRAASKADAKKLGSEVHVEEFAIAGETSTARLASADAALTFAADIRRRAERGPVPFFDRASWTIERRSETDVNRDLTSDTGTPAAQWTTGPLRWSDLRVQPDTGIAEGLPDGEYPALRFARALTQCWAKTVTVLGERNR